VPSPPDPDASMNPLLAAHHHTSNNPDFLNRMNLAWFQKTIIRKPSPKK
jgi:hypothetical protein